MTEVRFARSGDVDIAYRVVGDGPVDLVYVEGAFTHLEVAWELPQYRRWCERLAEFTRLVMFDNAGWACRIAFLGRHRSRCAWTTYEQ